MIHRNQPGHLPAQQEVLAIAEKWRPYRSWATSYPFSAAFEPAGQRAFTGEHQGGSASHRWILVMRAHLTANHHGHMAPAPALYTIRIDGHLGAHLLQVRQLKPDPGSTETDGEHP